MHRSVSDMSTASDSGGSTSAPITYTKSGEIYQSASSTSNQEYDFLDFLGVAQSLKIDFLPITWQPALDKVGEGGTAVIRQALINLQMTFTFKHLKCPRSAVERTRNLRALIAEISVLGHPAIRHHPNVANIEGICWDVVLGGEEVWPVLVFEKTRYGDLNRFMTSGPGKELDPKHKLEMLFDVALAVRDLHATGVIHGDIKPENILVSSDSDGHYVAKVTDFGYSTLFATDSDPVTMPYSELWTAPERHHREILPMQARKMDAYSFGMLCVWLLFYNKGPARDRNFKKDLEDSQKELSIYASELLRASADLENWEKDKMQKVFRSALAHDPRERTANFNEFLELLSPHRVSCLESPADSIFIPHNDFQRNNAIQITLSLHQLIQAHYGVRCYIASSLEERENRPFTSQCHLLNLALCYELGLGGLGDITKCRSLLCKHKIPMKDLEDKIEQAKRITALPEFQNGIFRKFFEQYHFSAFNFSQQYREEQRSREAELQYQREAKTMESILGDDHLLVEEVQRQLSFLMSSGGRWKDAEKLQLRMIELDKRALKEGQYSGALLLDLARTYRNQGRWKEAEKLEIQVVEDSKRLLGMEHPYTLACIADLVATYFDQGRWKEAEERGTEVVEASKKVLGIEHPSTLIRMANLAAIYSDQGQLKKAEELGIEVIKISKKVLGMEHPGTLTYIANLAWLYSKQGQWKKAEERGIEVVEASKKVLGMEHPSTLIRMANLAAIYNDQGRLKKAEELGIEVVEISKKALGIKHPGTLIRMANLASIYTNQGRWKEAEELAMQVIKTNKEVLGMEHPNTLTSIATLASIYTFQGRWKEAEKLEIQVVETSKEVRGIDHPDTLTSMATLASIYIKQWRWEEAEELEKEVLEMSKRVLDNKEHPDTLTSMGNLACIYCKQGRWKEAEELEKKVLETSKRVLDNKEHPATLTRMANLVYIYSKQGRWKEAEELGIEVVETSKRVLGIEHPNVLARMANLACIYSKQARWKEAKELEMQVMEAKNRLK